MQDKLKNIKECGRIITQQTMETTRYRKYMWDTHWLTSIGYLIRVMSIDSHNNLLLSITQYSGNIQYTVYIENPHKVLLIIASTIYFVNTQ